jgi:hypothetical protein
VGAVQGADLDDLAAEDIHGVVHGGVIQRLLAPPPR